MMQDTLTDRPTVSRAPGIQSIARAAAVLRALEQVPDGLTLIELSHAVGLPKSTVHRLVGALTSEDLLAARPDGRIGLGGGLTRLAVARRKSLPGLVRPALVELRGRLGETVDLAVLDGAALRFVDQLPGDHRLRAVSAVGAEFPLHCTANGKALLAALEPEEALALLPARLPRHTPATITTRAALLRELEQVRRRGVAFDREEHTEGISAVGAVVLDAGGAVAAVLSVPVPTARFQGLEKRYESAVRAAAARASELLLG
jgi:DNA-binding IclR family transcriptional regulator